MFDAPARALRARAALVIVCLGCVATVRGQCLAGLGVHLGQHWQDLRVQVLWPAGYAQNSLVSNASFWLLLRTGAREPLATTIPGAVLSSDWPFDRAMQLRFPKAGLRDGSCISCEAHSWWLDGFWERRVFPAAESAMAELEGVPNATTVLFDDNALGLPRNRTIEWCVKSQSGCSGCTASGILAFDPSFRWEEGVLELVGSHRHTCALRETGRVQCWGWNDWGQLGINSTLVVSDDVQRWSERIVLLETAVVSVSAGWAHSCARTGEGQVWCWGSNAQGQLGTAGIASSAVPLKCSSGGEMTSIAASGNRTCGVFVNGSLACWGSNAWGELGLGDTAQRWTPTIVSGITVARVVLGWWHTCVLGLNERQLRCWGRNTWGQLGLGHTQTIGDDEPILSAPPLSGLGSIDSIGCGQGHVCVTLSNSTSLCWGLNDAGQLGLGHVAMVGDDEPVSIASALVQPGDVVVSWSLGSVHTCAILLDQWLKCWGADGFGELGLPGNASLGDNETVSGILPVQTGGSVLSVSARSYSTCVARHWGSVECWGARDGSDDRSRVRESALVGAVIELPMSKGVASLPEIALNRAIKAKQAALGFRHSCLLGHSGALRCWGLNNDGQLGLGHSNHIGDDEDPSSGPAVSTGGLVTAVSCGSFHTCAVLEGGSLRCWGLNSNGQLGLGHTGRIGHIPSTIPSLEGLVSVGGPVRSVHCGADFTCVVQTNGTIRCWGANDLGQLGLGHTLTIGDNELPSSVGTVSVGGIPSSIATGHEHSCALLADMKMVCWGSNSYGRLGYGHTNNIGDNESPSSAGEVPLGKNVIAMSCGFDHTCAVAVDGRVTCWGYNVYGQLGLGHQMAIGDNEQPSNVGSVPLEELAVSVSCGASHTCAILMSRRVQCWGRNDMGQLGLGSTQHIGDGEPVSNTIVPLKRETEFLFSSAVTESLSGASPSRTCAFQVDGAVECWGENSNNQLGTLSRALAVGTGASSTEDASAVQVGGATISASAGESFTCALVASGSIHCWGSNSNGVLGLGSSGWSQVGQFLGDNEAPSSVAPVSVGGAASSVSCGSSHCCAVLDVGTVRCWGANGFGELGLGHKNIIGDNELPSTTIALNLTVPVADVSCGILQTCALLRNGSVRCWGRNHFGQLGLGHTLNVGDDESPLAVPPVSLLAAARHVQCSRTLFAHQDKPHVCVILTDKRVSCWGSNSDGQLGLGHQLNIGDNELPSSSGTVSLGGAAEGIACGSMFSCAVLDNGAIRCWGTNARGQLGLSTLIASVGGSSVPSTFDTVPLQTPAQSVSCGAEHACAVMRDGEVRCWGSNLSGQLGVGSIASVASVQRISPTGVALPAIARNASCGTHHTCAVLVNGALHCWGNNNAGQLGLGHTRSVGTVRRREDVAAVDPKILFKIQSPGALLLPILRASSPQSLALIATRRMQGLLADTADFSAAPFRLIADDRSGDTYRSSLSVQAHPITRNLTACAPSPVRLQSDALCLHPASNVLRNIADSGSILFISKLDPVASLSPGDSIIITFGSAFPLLSSRLNVTVGGGMCSLPVTLNLTTMACTLEPGQGRNVSVVASFLDNKSAISISSLRTEWSFPPPVIQSVLPSVGLRGLGQQQLRIEGTGFGNANVIDSIRIGAFPCRIDQVADSFIFCTTVAMPNVSDTRMVLSSGGQVADFPLSVSQPALFSIVPNRVGPSNVSDILEFRIIGSGFLPTSPDSLVGRVGQSSCTRLEVISSTVIECEVVNPLDWVTNEVFLQFGSVTISSSALLSVAPLPAVDSIVSRSFPTTGGLSIRLRGEGLGFGAESIVSVAFGNHHTTEGLVWMSEFEVSVVLPPGVGKDVEVRVLFSRNVTSSPAFFAYDRPRVLSVTPSRVVSGARDVDFLICGSNFGWLSIHVSHASVAGHECSEAVPENASCVRCLHLAGPFTWPSETTASVTVGGQSSTSDPYVFDVLVFPRITSLSPPTAPTRGIVMRVIGEGFGGAQADIQSVFVGGQPALQWSVVSPFAIDVRIPPGVGRELDVEVLAASGQRSQPFSFSFERPSVSLVHPNYELAGAVNRTILVCGTNLGSEVGHVDWLRIGGHSMFVLHLQESKGADDEPETCITAWSPKLPANWPDSDSVSLSIGDQESPRLRGLFQGIPVPAISLFSAVSRPTKGGTEAVVFGDGFGRAWDDVEVVEVGLVTVAATEEMFVSGRELRFPLPPGVGSNHTVVVKMRSGERSNGVLFSYDPPVILSVEPEYILVGASPQSLVVEGTNFGLLETHFSRVRIGGVPCGRIEPRSSSSFLCHDLIANLNTWPDPNVLEVDVAGITSGRTRGILRTVDRPRVSSILPREIRIGEELAITGSGFGVQAADVVDVLVGSESCAEFVWETDQRIRCVLGDDHPMFSTKPANSSNPEVWPLVQVVLRTSVSSYGIAELVEAESTIPRVAPRSWIDSKFPDAVPFDVHGVREVGRFETVIVVWSVAEEQLSLDSPTLAVTGFEVRAESAAGESFTSFVPSANARSMELSTSSRWPLTVTVRARNAFGDGPASHSSDMIFENCDRTMFLGSHLEPSKWRCLPCPSQAVCGGLRSENVTARAGFWRIPWSAHSLGFATCRVQEACNGASDELEAYASPSLSVNRSGLLDVSRIVAVPGLQLDPSVLESCADAYEGVLCASCRRGFFRTATGQCESCGSTAMIALRVTGLLVLLSVLLTSLLLRAYKAAGESSSGVVRALKILFNHLQTVSIISAIRFRWPSSVTNAFAVSSSASLFGIEGVSLECVLGDAGYDPLQRSLLAVSTPVWLLLFAAVFWALYLWRHGDDHARPSSSLSTPPTFERASPASKMTNRARRDTIAGSVRTTESMWTRWARRMKVSALVLVFLIHTNVTTSAFRMITCESVAPDDEAESGQLRLSMDLQVRCDDPAALAWMVGISLPILVFVSIGVPTLTMWMIRRNRKELQDPKVQRLFGFLFLGYRPGYEWWESVNILRKVFLAGVTVILGPSGAFNQVGGTIVVMLTFMAMHAWYRPSADAVLNRLEMASLFAASLTMVSGQFIQVSASQLVRDIVAPAMLFTANSVFLVLSISFLATELCRKAHGRGAIQAGSTLGTPPVMQTKPSALVGFSTQNIAFSPFAPADRAKGVAFRVRGRAGQPAAAATVSE